MQDWIAGAMLVLGTLLVLGGGSAAFSSALAENRRPADLSATEVKKPWWADLIDSIAKLKSAADRLIVWGIVLLVIAAIAAGAISFNLGASASS